jgi:hypothetical protein
MKVLKISDTLALPIEAVTEKLGFLGRTGAGKTYAAQRLAEEMHRANAQFVAIDPVGKWWSLRLASDGVNPGLSIPVFGGLHGDVPLEPTGGKLIADVIVDRGVSVVVDVSQFESDSQKARFMTDFGNRFFFRKKSSPSAVHLFIEESQEFIPQNPQRDESLMLHAWTRIQKLGRNFGIGSSLISQRPQEVNKKVLNLTEVLFVFQLTGPQERKAVAWWIEEKGIDEDIASELPKLRPGCPHIWSPAWLQVSKIIQISRKETYDASSTPKVGARAEVKSLAPIDLENLRKDMASTIERAKQEDPRELRKKIAELERQLRTVPVPVQTIETKTKEVPILKDSQIGRLEKIVENLRTVGDKLTAPIDELASKLVSSLSLMAKQGILITEALKKYSSRPAILPQKIETKVNLALVNKYQRGAPSKQPLPPQRIIKEGGDEPPRTLRLGERRMLDVLCRWYPARLTKAQLATLSRLKVTSGTFSAYYGTLKRANLIDESSNGVQVSELGLYVHGGIKSVPQTTDEIIQMWRSSLRAGERKLLDILVEIYPDSISKNELAERAELTASSGTFGAYLGTLRRNGLAETRDGEVKAGEVLFLKK